MQSTYTSSIVSAEDEQKLRVIVVNESSIILKIVVPNPYTDLSLFTTDGRIIQRSVLAAWASDHSVVEVPPGGASRFDIHLVLWYDIHECIEASCTIKVDVEGKMEEIVAKGRVCVNIPSLEDRLMVAKKMKKQGIVPHHGMLNVSKLVSVSIVPSKCGV